MARIVGMCLLLCGCTGNTLTPEEQYQRQETYHKWYVCPNEWGIHIDHTSKDHRPGHWSIRYDIARNARPCSKFWQAYGL